MYIPHTPNGNVLFTFTGSVFENVRDTLKSKGWEEVDGAAPYTWLKATSPQGMISKLRMRQYVHNSYFGLCTEFSFGENHQGASYYVKETGGNFQIVANCCQFFMSTIGVESSVWGSNFSGGIPFVPPLSIPYGEVWWASGDGIENVFYYGLTFRKSLLHKSYESGAIDLITRDAYFNEMYCGGFNVGSPRIETLVCAGEIDYIALDQLANATYLSDKGIYLPALISWGDTNTSQHKVRGILWDAMVCTAPAVLDSILMYDAQNWINFTHEFYYGSLYLLLPELGTGNYTY
jgi:hypothetical protein